MSVENPWAGQGHFSRYTHYNSTGFEKIRVGRYNTTNTTSASLPGLFTHQNVTCQQVKQNEKLDTLKKRLKLKPHGPSPVTSPQASHTSEQIRALVGLKIQEILNSNAKKLKQTPNYLTQQNATEHKVTKQPVLKPNISISCLFYSPSCSHLLTELAEKIKAIASTMDLTKGPQILRAELSPNDYALFQVGLDIHLPNTSLPCTIQ